MARNLSKVKLAVGFHLHYSAEMIGSHTEQ
jgi:hypothetical protein